MLCVFGHFLSFLGLADVKKTNLAEETKKDFRDFTKKSRKFITVRKRKNWQNRKIHLEMIFGSSIQLGFVLIDSI